MAESLRIIVRTGPVTIYVSKAGSFRIFHSTGQFVPRSTLEGTVFIKIKHPPHIMEDVA